MRVIRTEEDVVRLKDLQVTEDKHLDYKRTLAPRKHEGKFELLKDVSAMANADGGTIICGVAQDEAGAPSDLPGLTISKPDEFTNDIDQVLNDNLDEKVPGIRHGPIPRKDGTFFYCIHIPASPLAPHMITMVTKRPRFYARINTVNAPMNASQIKQIATRHMAAEDRALAFVGRRLGWLNYGPEPWYALHFVPLFSEGYALDIADGSVTSPLVGLGLVGGDTEYNVHGFSVVWASRKRRQHVLFTRDGAVEIFRWPISVPHSFGDYRLITGTGLRDEILETVKKVAGADIPGLVQPPFLLHLHVANTAGTGLIGDDTFPFDQRCEAHQIAPESLVVHDWDEGLTSAVRRFLDVIWQAYDTAGCPWN